MKQINNYILILSAVLVGLILVSCSGNDDDDLSGDGLTTKQSKSKDDKLAEIELIGTSWNILKHEYYDSYGNSKELTSNAKGTVTFTKYGQDPQFTNLIEPYELHLIGVGNTGYDHYGQWEIINGILYISPHFLLGETSVQSAMLFEGIPDKSEIISLTDKKLILNKKNTSGGGYLYYFTSTKYKEASNVPSSISDGSGSNNNSGGGSQSESGEPPHVIDFQFTPTSTSISVRFVASDYPSMARIKMGKDMNNVNTFLSETIAGKHVTGTAKNLKKATKYYFKCLLKNKYGTSESAVYPAMTLSE